MVAFLRNEAIGQQRPTDIFGIKKSRTLLSVKESTYFEHIQGTTGN